MNINELVTLVAIALGSSDVSTCRDGDIDGNGVVEVHELIAAVGAALRGCSGDPAAAALAVVRGLSQLENLSDGLAVALDAVGGPEICELGGGLSSMCEDPGTGTFLTSTTADHCRVVTDEGPIEYQGNVAIRAAGQCPDVLSPFGVRFALDWDAMTLGPAGERLITAHHDTDVVLETFLFGMSPCIIKGGAVTASGPIVYRGAGDREVTLTLQDTHATAHFIDLHGNCDPMSVATEIEGPVRIDDTYGDGPFGLDATLQGVTVTVHRVEHTLEFAGQVDAACFGGPVRIETLSPLGFPARPALFHRRRPRRRPACRNRAADIRRRRRRARRQRRRRHA